MNPAWLLLVFPLMGILCYLSEGSLPNCIYKCRADLKKKRLRQKVESAFDCYGGNLIHKLDLMYIAEMRQHVAILQDKVRKLEERGSI